MREWVTKSRRLVSLLGLMTLVLALPACGGSSSGGSGPPPTVTCAFTSNNAAAAADLVRFTDNVVVAGNLCTLEVAIGGATTDSNYYAFAFDVEMLYLAGKLGYKVAEVPVSWRNDERTKVKLLSDPPKMFFDLMRIRWRHGRAK